MEASVETAMQGVAKPILSILTPAVSESFSCNAPMSRCAEMLLLPENWGDASEPLSLANFLDEPIRNYGLGMLAWGSLKEGSSHPLIRGPILLVLGGENNEEYGFFLIAGKRLKRACDTGFQTGCEALAEYESVLGQSRIQVMLREGRYQEAMELIKEAAKSISEVDPEWEGRSMRQVYEAITDKVLRSVALHDTKIIFQTMELIEESAVLLEEMDKEWPDKMHRQMQPDIELTMEASLYENNWDALISLHETFSPLREEGWGDNWKARITFRAEQKINECIDTLQWKEANEIVKFFDGFQSDFWVKFWVDNLDYLERMGGRQ